MEERLMHFKMRKQQGAKTTGTAVSNSQKKPLSENKPRNTRSNPNKAKNIQKLKKHKELSNENETISQREDSNQMEQLTMREKLEKWREQKGKNKPDTVNPLLSRKRPLVGYEKKTTAKRRKNEKQINGKKAHTDFSDALKESNKKKVEQVIEDSQKNSKAIVQNSNDIEHSGDAVGQTNGKAEQNGYQDTEVKEVKKGQNISAGNEREGKHMPMSNNDAQEPQSLARKNQEATICPISESDKKVRFECVKDIKEVMEADKNNTTGEVCFTKKCSRKEEEQVLETLNGGIQMEIIREENEEEESFCQEKEEISLVEKSLTSMNASVNNGYDKHGDGGKKDYPEERVASYSHFYRGAFQSRQNVKHCKARTPEQVDRRKTICLTHSVSFSANRPAIKNEPLRSEARRSVSVAMPGISSSETPSNVTTPLRNGKKCSPPDSVLNSAPCRRSDVSRKRMNSIEQSKDSLTKRKRYCMPEDTIQKEKCSTPFYRRMSRLPETSVLKSAPRRSLASAKNTDTGTQYCMPEDMIQKEKCSTPFYRRMSRLPETSVLKSAPRRSLASAKNTDTVTQYCMPEDTIQKEKCSTPFYRRMSRLPETSVLKKPPGRSVASAKKTDMPVNLAASKPKIGESNLIFSTPLRNHVGNLPASSILRSAPSRRSISAISITKTRETVGQKEAKSVTKTRRKTIHLAKDMEPGSPEIVAPFTPNQEWQNKALTIRERLDMWLTAKGNTIKKPFVVQKTTAKVKKSMQTPDDIGLNTTFDLNTSAEHDDVDCSKEIEKRIPKMNELERAVVEESLQQMLIRLEKSSENDTIKDELDLVLSTSPGVVRLALFWIIRARLAAANEDVERVICLLEQANAFDAQPQSIIRDEVCKYLEELKRDDLEFREPGFDGNDFRESSRKSTATPGKRVTFAESQQHMVFKSSLIKFCLLECTPFRKKLKTTLTRKVLTPVRRSGRIEKVESRLPSVVRCHLPTVSSPRDFETDIRDGEVYFLPNPNVDSKWNDIWGVKKADENEEHDLSFC